MEAAIKNTKAYEQVSVPDLPAPNAVERWMQKIAEGMAAESGFHDDAEIAWIRAVKTQV